MKHNRPVLGAGGRRGSAAGEGERSWVEEEREEEQTG